MQVTGIPAPSWSHTQTCTHVGMTPVPTGMGIMMGIMGIVWVTGQITGLSPISIFLGFIQFLTGGIHCWMTMVSREKLCRGIGIALREFIHDFRYIPSYDIPGKCQKIPPKIVFQWNFD